MSYKYIKVVQIQVYAISGAALDKALTDSAILALTEYRTVLLIHNDRNYVIAPHDITDFLVKFNN